MTKDYKFKLGQGVKMKDPDDGEMVYGVVVDTTSYSVFIKWDDLSEPCEHFESEYEQIKIRTK